MTDMTRRMFMLVVLIAGAGLQAAAKDVDREAWRDQVGQAGPSGWSAHVIHPDPHDHGPDGFNANDWDGDGHLDVLINYEEGGYSRLFFNPGPKRTRQVWTEFIQFDHGGEDSGMGDLDHDGDMDYVAKGNVIYFNPGPRWARDQSRWTHTSVPGGGSRSPTVADINGDGLNDLVIDGSAWYEQPRSGKEDGTNWTRHEVGKTKWVMSTYVTDMDGDGDPDILIQDRRVGTYYFTNPGNGSGAWVQVMIDPTKNCMFMALGDVNGDGRQDLVRAGRDMMDIFLRTNDRGAPVYHHVPLSVPTQASGRAKGAKGVTLLNIGGNDQIPEILAIPEHSSDFWVTYLRGDGSDPGHWETTLVPIPGANTRKKMDNIYQADIDGDGDMDLATTEENGGWGVIWFENPGR